MIRNSSLFQESNNLLILQHDFVKTRKICVAMMNVKLNAMILYFLFSLTLPLPHTWHYAKDHVSIEIVAIMGLNKVSETKE